MELGHVTDHSGVLERLFVVERAARTIPGVLWEPIDGRRGPVVLLGHGGSGSTADGYVVSLARSLVRDHGCVCASIDGPVHGRRRGDRSDDPRLVLLDFSQAWSGDPTMTDEMVADWMTTLDELLVERDLEGAPVGYWGLSMGTLLGLPLVAAEERIGACVLGLAGITGPTTARLRDDARRLRCPVFFALQWDDELFERATALELFDELGSTDKQLHATPGGHASVTPETFQLSAAFLLSRLS